MAEKIILWKDQPKRQLQELLTYLKEHDSHTAASNFLKKLKVKSNRLKKYPGSGQRTRFKTIRRVRLDKYRSLFYRVHGRKIFILFLWDGRQDPARNPYK
jgi:plasmid stabilization system protein ParE